MNRRTSLVATMPLLSLWLHGPPAKAAPAAPRAQATPLEQALGRHGAVRAVSRGKALPHLLIGPLSAPAQAPSSPQAIVARALLDLRAAAPELVPDELSPAEVLPISVHGGHVVRLGQTHHGLPVLGGEIVARLDDRGQIIRLVRQVAERAALSRVDLLPRVPAGAAAEIVRGLRPGQAASSIGTPELAIDPEESRLVWLVPSRDLTRLENAHYVIDAGTGQALRRIERLRFADQFRVYLPNPVIARNSATAMPLPGGAGGPFTPQAGAPRRLTSALLKGSNCIDNKTTRDVQGLNVHLCAATQTAAADGSGNFDGLPPLVNGDDGRCPLLADANQNGFAEAHMYWHAANIYDRFRRLYAGLGRSDFKLRVSTGADPRPLPLVVNLCIPDFTNLGTIGDVSRPLQPFENAFFSPGGQGSFNEILSGQDTDAIAFGMGRRTNFALDGDVIYHEFTHAIVWSRSKLLYPSFDDEHGPNVDPGAMNEGLADFFSSGLTGDPAVGEYAWKNFSSGGGGLRDLDNAEHCSRDRIGEIHEDSRSFSGALWSARKEIAGDPARPGARHDTFDQAVLAALDGSGPRPSMTDMAELLKQEVGMRAAQLGADAAARIDKAFQAHGVLPACDRVIRELKDKPALCIDGTDSKAGRRLVAGHVQWRVEVPPTADTITVQLSAQAGSCSGSLSMTAPPAPRLKLAVRRADEALTWERDEGTQDDLIDMVKSGSSWEGRIDQARGVLHVMIANAGGGIIGRNISFALNCENPMGCKAPEPPPMDKDMKDKGCGCRVGAGDAGAPSAGALAGLGLLLALLRRRRRTP